MEVLVEEKKKRGGEVWFRSEEFGRKKLLDLNIGA